MSTPLNRYYLRSTEDEGNSEDLYESNLALSDHEDTFVSENSDFADIINSTFVAIPKEMASQIHMPLFHGNPGECASNWLKWFNNYCDVNTVAVDKRTKLIPFYLRDHALAWFHTLPSTVTDDLDRLKEAIASRFNGSDGLDANIALFNLCQIQGETTASYFTRIYQTTAAKGYPEELLVSLALKGLSNNLKAIVMPQNHKTLEDLRKGCSLAEQTLAATNPVTSAPVAAVGVNDIIGEQLRTITKKLSDLELKQQSNQTWSRRNYQRQQQHRQPRRPPQNSYQNAPCKKCPGESHVISNCPYQFDKFCAICGKRNHLKSDCWKNPENQ